MVFVRRLKCPLCDFHTNSYRGAKAHFADCVVKKGNPNGYQWNDCFKLVCCICNIYSANDQRTVINHFETCAKHNGNPQNKKLSDHPSCKGVATNSTKKRILRNCVPPSSMALSGSASGSSNASPSVPAATPPTLPPGPVNQSEAISFIAMNAPSTPPLEADQDNLPQGWRRKEDSLRQTYYLDDNTRTTHWYRPRLASDIGDRRTVDQGGIPAGWERREDYIGRTYFVNYNTEDTIAFDRPTGF